MPDLDLIKQVEQGVRGRRGRFTRGQSDNPAGRARSRRMAAGERSNAVALAPGESGGGVADGAGGTRGSEDPVPQHRELDRERFGVHQAPFDGGETAA